VGTILNILRVVTKRRIQLIHAHEFYMNALGAIVSRITGIPLIATVHGKGYYPEKRRRNAIYRMTAAQAAVVVTVSRDLRDFFCQATRTPRIRVQVIYNGIDWRALSDAKRDPSLLESVGIPPDAPVVGTVGSLYPVKGQVHLISAARTILQYRPKTHVVILGQGGLENDLAAQAEAFDIQDRIHLLGYRDDVAKWLGSMDVFTLPSLSEGLPLSLLEAMAAGIPTVITQVGGMPEAVCHGQTGFIVPPGDSEALAGKIMFLLDNPVVAAEVAAAARRRVRALFSQDRMVSEYRVLYQRALAPRLKDSMLQ
jgi:glycosyltransferase involved in cell wall biosynthesis